MPKTFDETLALIRTLLAIADGGSPHEAERELARSRAERLMLRHSVDEAGVRMTRQGARADPGGRRDRRLVGDGPVRAARGRLPRVRVPVAPGAARRSDRARRVRL